MGIGQKMSSTNGLYRRMGGDEFVIITKFRNGDEKVTKERSLAVAKKVIANRKIILYQI